MDSVGQINLINAFLTTLFSSTLVGCVNNIYTDNYELPSSTPRFSSYNSESFGGNLFHVLTLKNGQYAFASLSQKKFKNENGNIEKSGFIVVLKKINSVWKIQNYINVNTLSLSNEGTAGGVYGMALTPDESVLAVTIENKVALLNVNTLLQGNPIVTYVDLDADHIEKTGAVAVVASNDNKHFFIANEYGRSESHAGIGDVAIISVTLDKSQIVQGQRLGYIKTGQNSIASLSISPDGKTLYIPNQVASKADNMTFSGKNNHLLSKMCGNTNYSGSISVVDVDKAISFAEQNHGGRNTVIDDVILANVAAGCNPVRVAPSFDGKTIWVTARGNPNIRENLIHAYDAELIRTNPENAYIYSLKSNGESPIGITAFENDKYIAVSNSNRFKVKDNKGNILSSNISIFDVSNKKNPRLVNTLKSGDFPRNISVSFDSKKFYVANWNSGFFQEIKLSN